VPVVLRMPDFSRTSVKGTVAVVVIENVFAAVESGGPTSNHYAFVKARAGFGNGSSFQIEINVIGDEKIEGGPSRS